VLRRTDTDDVKPYLNHAGSDVMSAATRRTLVAATFVIGSLVVPAWGADDHHTDPHAAPAHDPAPVPISKAVSAIAPSALDVLDRLKEGNARYVAGELTLPNLSAERRCDTSTAGQHPLATILSCADSRVPPEFIFDAGIGELFVIRVAGNVADTDEIGTAEYGAGHLHTPLIVVMGHGKCGAVTAVVNGADVGGSIPKLVDNIIPAANEAKKQGYTGDRLIKAAIAANVRQSQADLLTKSAEIRELVESGKVMLVGAVYDLHNGTIQWLGEHPQQLALLEGKFEPQAELTHEDPLAGAVASADDVGAHGAAPVTKAPAKEPAAPKPAAKDAHADEHAKQSPAKDEHRNEPQGKDAHAEDPHAKDAHEGESKHEEDPAEKPVSAKDHVPAADRQGWLLPIVLAAGSAALSGGAVMLFSMKKGKSSTAAPKAEGHSATPDAAGGAAPAGDAASSH
jgi:carbonic anhydrase